MLYPTKEVVRLQDEDQLSWDVVQELGDLGEVERDAGLDLVHLQLMRVCMCNFVTTMHDEGSASSADPESTKIHSHASRGSHVHEEYI